MWLYVGCATTSTQTIQVVYDVDIAGKSAWPDGILESRFKEYWYNRFSGQVEKNYYMENPYFQEVVSLGKYRNYVQYARRNVLQRMEISEIERQTDYLVTIQCNAVVMRDGSSQAEVSMVDRWVNVDGKWYHAIKDPLLSL